MSTANTTATTTAIATVTDKKEFDFNKIMAVQYVCMSVRISICTSIYMYIRQSICIMHEV